ncbi:ATP-binding protein [Streptomyces lavendulae]|nr:ATP-binding protein [Streptomyces lavendulae]
MVTPLSQQTTREQGLPLPLRYSMAWDATHTSITDARRAVRVLLDEAGHHPDQRPSQDAQLVVSELVTNAIRHAPGPGALTLELTSDATLLRITVRDSSSRPPVLPTPDPGRPGGHGLRLVTLLCDRLQHTALTTGKQIVAQLRLG